MRESNKHSAGEGSHKESDTNFNFQEHVYADDRILEMYVSLAGLLNLKITRSFHSTLVSLQYDHVIMVSRYLVLTVFTYTQHGCPVSKMYLW